MVYFFHNTKYTNQNTKYVFLCRFYVCQAGQQCLYECPGDLIFDPSDNLCKVCPSRLDFKIVLFVIFQEKSEGPACNYAGIKVPTTTTTTTTTTAATTTTTTTAATTQSITATRSLPIECYSEECDPPGYSPYKIFPCNKWDKLSNCLQSPNLNI